MKSQRCNQAQQRGHRSQPLRLGHRSTLEQISGQRQDPHVCAARNHAAPGRGRKAAFWEWSISWRNRNWATSNRKYYPAFAAPSAPPALFFSKLAPYIRGAGSPAMEINDRRNKPFGPGGSTRRLHPSPPLQDGFRRGRTRIDEGVKGEFFPGMVPPLSGYAIVANDNYAPVAQAA